jgi:hypothetical protein
MSNEWEKIVRAALGHEADEIIRAGKADPKEIAKRLEAKGINPKLLAEKMTPLASEFLESGMVPMLIPPVVSPVVFRAPYSLALHYDSNNSSGFDTDGHRLAPIGPNGSDVLMDTATGRVGHNVVSSNPTHAACTLNVARCSMVGIPWTMRHSGALTITASTTRLALTEGVVGSVPFWGSASAQLSSYTVIEVYVGAQGAGNPTASSWILETTFRVPNAGGTATGPSGAGTSQAVSFLTSASFSKGQEVKVFVGLGTQHTGAASNADLTVRSTETIRVDSISFFP